MVKQNLSFDLSSVLIAIGLLAIAAVLYMYLPKLNRYLDLKARQDCAESYRLQYVDQKANTTVIRPVDDLYKKCLAEKGL